MAELAQHVPEARRVGPTRHEARHGLAWRDQVVAPDGRLDASRASSPRHCAAPSPRTPRPRRATSISGSRSRRLACGESRPARKREVLQARAVCGTRTSRDEVERLRAARAPCEPPGRVPRSIDDVRAGRVRGRRAGSCPRRAEEDAQSAPRTARPHRLCSPLCPGGRADGECAAAHSRYVSSGPPSNEPKTDLVQLGDEDRRQAAAADGEPQCLRVRANSVVAASVDSVLRQQHAEAARLLDAFDP